LPSRRISSNVTVDTELEGLFAPHPNFSNAVNHNLAQSEIEGGVHLVNVPPETVLEVQTMNHLYTIIHQGLGKALISGHPKFCPLPVMVQIQGSTWGGSMLKQSFIGRGMHLEFRHPAYLSITTSRIVEVRARVA
jgi:hypothetical protein